MFQPTAGFICSSCLSMFLINQLVMSTDCVRRTRQTLCDVTNKFSTEKAIFPDTAWRHVSKRWNKSCREAGTHPLYLSSASLAYVDANCYYFTFILMKSVQSLSFQEVLLKQHLKRVLPELKRGRAELCWGWLMWGETWDD